MRKSKQRFIGDRIPYHQAILAEKHPDVPLRALEYWAKDAAEKEYRKGRVYADPVQIESAEIHVYDQHASYGSGQDRGINLRFNPGGPMVSVMSLSYAEARELAIDLINHIDADGEWSSDLSAELPPA
jgi:hypothetical protein